MEKAKETLENYLEAWSKNDVKAMHELCQKTYKVSNTEFDLKKVTPAKLKEFTILEGVSDTPCVTDFEVELLVKRAKKTAKARLVCEKAPFKPSEQGEWGVNPISLLKAL